MNLEKIKAQPATGEINVIIEIPMNSDPVKYELDKESGATKVDRFMQTAMFYPCNYGFIPNTLSGDGDPVDVLVVCHYPVIPNAILRSRPIGVLMMEDDGGQDEKILAVPVSKLDTTFDKILDVEDLDLLFRKRIVHFFEHYKDLEKGKWVKIIGWEGASSAHRLIEEGVSRYEGNTKI
jgi:inorganic pyrophosphatase